MSDQVFKDTKNISINGKSLCVYINRIFGVEEGDTVILKMTSAEDPDRMIYATKKVVKVNGSYIVYVDKVWGFSKGEKVYLEVQVRKNRDAGVSDKKGDQEVS